MSALNTTFLTSALGVREVDCMSRHTGGAIDILAITGRFFFFSPNVAEALRKRNTGLQDNSLSVARINLINPVSQQAIFRAIADTYPEEKIGERILNWSWEAHQQSQLYQDVFSVLNKIEKDRARKVDLRLFSGAASCSFVITSESAFIEQYVYGRTTEFREGGFLGGEFPVLEFAMSDSKNALVKEILTSSFNVMWESFSLPFEDFRKRDIRIEFERNIEGIRLDLGLIQPARSAGASS